jgi:hypothetical protein
VTPYSKAYLTGGCWSGTRAGVFFVTRNDGALDACAKKLVNCCCGS